MAEKNFSFSGDNLTDILTGLFTAGATVGSAAITGHYGNQSNSANKAYQNSTGGTYVVTGGGGNSDTPKNTNQTNEKKIPSWAWVVGVVVLIAVIGGLIYFKKK